MGDLLTQCLAGSLASADRWSRCVCGYGVILVGRWGCKAFLQEGLPLVQMWSLQNRSDIRRSLEPLCLRLWGRPRRTVGLQSLCSRGPALGPCSRCLPGTCVVLSSMAYCSCFQRFLSWILKENIGLNDRSHTLLLLVVRRQPTVAVVLATEVLGASGAPQGVIGTEISGASVSENSILGGATSAPGSSGAMSLEFPGSYLLGSSNSASLPINWRRVESKAELVFSSVATTERLLHQTLASVHHNILRPV
jgi:hypothetical protein